MRLGICGWSASGKSTVFDVLAGGEAHQHPSGRARLGTGHIKDKRLDFLAEVCKPKKVTYAAVEYLDLPALVTGPHAREANPGTLADARQTDGLVAVVRAFEDPTVTLPFGDIDPVRDFERLWDELVFADLEVAERRIEKLRKDVERPTPHQAEDKAELALLDRVKAALEEGRAVSEMDLSQAEKTAIRGFQFLTAKPLLVLLNRGEEAAGEESPLGEKDFGRPVVEMFAKLELELDQLPPDDRAVFIEEMGLRRLAAPQVIRKSLETLDLISFLTGNEKECRAWTVPRGTTAVEAAGAVHSDMERGFIRAQVVAFEDLKALGSFKEARAHGKLRLEGRDYIVQDGDQIEFRFSV